MKKFALLAMVAGLFVVADVADAGVFRRGGGCPGGVCSVNMATAPAPALAATEAPPAPAKAPEVAAQPTETTPAAEATTESTTRAARGRGLLRRRG